ncbi:MAG: hypothetical protein OXN94_16590 [Chloroflexota bacterium]|nr:hypothetical protein [Chloroflexota bacterium]MDE2950993.1 hypothetical protein [Chloroflexota bacterium]
MLSRELLDELHQLERADKAKVIQILAGELAIDEEAYFQDGTYYDFWSPIDAPEAANLLLNMLDEKREMNSAL